MDLDWCIEQLITGSPFSFVRWSEGEWHTVIPSLPFKAEIAKQPPDPAFEVWTLPEAVERMREAVLSTPRSPRFLVADYADHDWKISGAPEYSVIRDGWKRDNGIDDLDWLSEMTWSRAVAEGKFHAVIDALRACPLSLIFVGPERIRECILSHFNATFIPVHSWNAFPEIDDLKEKLISLSPACISLSADGTAKIAITELFPIIGEESFMIDFGAVWDGLCGYPIRVYQRDHWNNSVIKETWR